MFAEGRLGVLAVELPSKRPRTVRSWMPYAPWDLRLATFRRPTLFHRRDP